MNLPNTIGGNWSWRYQARALTDERGARLNELTDLYAREPQRPKAIPV